MEQSPQLLMHPLIGDQLTSYFSLISPQIADKQIAQVSVGDNIHTFLVSVTMFPTPTSESSMSQDQESTVRLPVHPQRPRLLRAMTSPMPILGTYATQSGDNSQLSWNLIAPGKGIDAQDFEGAPPADNSQGLLKPGSQLLQANQLPAASRSSLTPCEMPLQSVSSSSALPLLTSATLGPSHCNSSFPIVPPNHKISITDSMKRHWSKGQAFHWFLDAQQVEGVTRNPSR